MEIIYGLLAAILAFALLTPLIGLPWLIGVLGAVVAFFVVAN